MYNQWKEMNLWHIPPVHLWLSFLSYQITSDHSPPYNYLTVVFLQYFLWQTGSFLFCDGVQCFCKILQNCWWNQQLKSKLIWCYSIKLPLFVKRMCCKDAFVEFQLSGYHARRLQVEWCKHFPSPTHPPETAFMQSHLKLSGDGADTQRQTKM